MMKVLGKCFWQGFVLVVLLVILSAGVAQSQSAQDVAATIQALQEQAHMLMALDQWEAAIPVLYEALQLSRAIGDRRAESQILTSLGECYRRAELLKRALAYYEQARAAYAALDMASSPEMAVVLFGTAKTWASLGNLGDAVTVLYEAQEIFKAQELWLDAAQVTHEIGRLFISLGQYEQALESYHEALEIYRFYGGLVEVIGVYQDIGCLLVQLDMYEEALGHFHAALSNALEIDYTDAVAEAYVEISGVYFALGLYEDALNALSQAESLYEHHESWLELASIQLRYAELQSVLGRDEQVLDYYGKAVEYLKMVLSDLDEISPVEGMRYSRPVTRLQILLRIGLCLETLEQWDEAVQIYQHAVEVTEAMPWLTNNEANGVYQRLISLLARLERGTDALVYAERWRARTILDLLYQSGVVPEQLVNPGAGFLAGMVDSEAIDVAVEEAIGCLQANEAVLEYFATERGVYLWTITGSGVSEPIFIDYPREQLLADVVEFRTLLEDPTSREWDWLVTVELLAEFYQKLVAPAMLQLPREVNTLILIPDGPLYYLPFSALIMADQVLSIGLGSRHPYLVERYTLAYLPSLASLPTLMASETEEGCFLGFIGTFEVDGYIIEDPQLEPLIRCFGKCLVEDDQDASIYIGEDATESRLKAECSDARFLMLLCPVRSNLYIPWQNDILLAEDEENDGHLHAWEVLGLDFAGTELVVLPVVATLLPYLQRLQDTMFNPEPWGELCYVGSPRNLGIQVASSQHASGEVILPEFLEKLVSGEDVTIWPLAFMSAGAKAVLQTLWLANPDALEKLLVAMCEYHWQGDTWAQSLRAAQLDLITNDVFKSPWFWAPYQLIGRWR